MDLVDYVCGLSFKNEARSTEARMQLQLQLLLVEMELNEAIIQLAEMKSREDRMQEQVQFVRMTDVMNLSTTLWPVYGGWMEDPLRSREDRMQEQLQLVEKKLNEAIIQVAEIKKSDWWKLITTQKSDDGDLMKLLQRSKVARMQKQLLLVEMELNEAIIQLAEMKLNEAIIQLVVMKKSDWWKLLTTQKSDDGGWMKDYLSPELQRPDRSQVKAPRERNRSSLVRIKHQSMEGIVTFQGEPSSPWDVMNLPTALQAVVGGGM